MHDVKDYGIVCDLAANPDVVGLVATQQVRRSNAPDGRISSRKQQSDYNLSPKRRFREMSEVYRAEVQMLRSPT